MNPETAPILVAVVENDYSIPTRLRTRLEIEAISKPVFGRVRIKQIQALESADASVCDIPKLVASIESLQPHLVVLDLAILPDDLECGLVPGKEPTGIRVLRELAPRLPATPVIVFSNLVDAPGVRRELLDIQRARPQSRIELVPKQDHCWPRLVDMVGQICAAAANGGTGEPGGGARFQSKKPNLLKSLARVLGPRQGETEEL